MVKKRKKRGPSTLTCKTRKQKAYWIIFLEAGLNKDINEPLWNVYRIPSKIGANGYSISSSLNENNLLNQLISFAKNKWKEGKTVVSIDDEDGSGYLFKYIITLIRNAVTENPEIIKSKMGFTRYISQYFDDVQKVNDEPLTKADAEMLKRNEASSDLNSFKRKGAAIFRELEKMGVEKKSLSKLTVSDKRYEILKFNQPKYNFKFRYNLSKNDNVWKKFNY